MDLNPQWITLVLACTAMIASIAGPFVNTRIARIQFKANVLSVNRQKWIETLRNLVASLNSQFLAVGMLRQTVGEPAAIVVARDPEMFKRVETLLETVSKIELMLNPLEPDHQQLTALMKDGIAQLRSPPPGHAIEGRIELIGDEITKIAQAVLKREWVRVKRGE